MKITPSIRSNFFTNANPLGIEKMMSNYLDEIQKMAPYQGPKRVLIIGGSSGYGLASRISLAFKAGSHTMNVSFESPAKGNRTGSAGYWNNIFFLEQAKKLETTHLDFNGDAFSPRMKQKIAETIKSKFGPIDLLIYSLASGARRNFETGELIRSSLKPIGKEAVGKTIDLKSLQIEPLTVMPASAEEIDQTVFVMGGSDWYDWVHYLEKEGLLAPHFKTISYTYVGGKNTDDIYRHGTIGKAKEDLEATVDKLNRFLTDKYQGEALISSSKAIVSKASVFIPQMPIYVSYLFDVMLKNKTHETTLAHKHRLFKDMVYGHNRILDNEKRIRLDHLEMEETTQKEVSRLMKEPITDAFFNLPGTKLFLKEFQTIHGFAVDGIADDIEVDLDKLSEKHDPNIYQFIED